MKDTDRIAELERKLDIIIEYLIAHDRMFRHMNDKIDLVKGLTSVNSNMLNAIENIIKV